MRIGNVEIGGDNPCRFIAELSCNHGGSLDRCLRMITAAKDAGADIIKTQCYTPDELVALRGDGPAPEPWGSQGHTMRSLYEKAQTPHDWFPAINEYCRDLEIPWFSSVFGPESLALLESLDCPAYKIARLDNASTALIHATHATRKPMVVSIGPDDGIEPNAQLRLWCPVGYPQSEFGFGHDLWNDHCEFDGDLEPAQFDGFSYHGETIEPCVVAATLGAKVIEAHFQLYLEQGEFEANVSLDEHAFKAMVRTVRRVEAVLA